MMATCKNCNGEVTLNYCPSCGHPAKLKRIDGHYIWHEIEHVLHFERGILYTIRELITSPGRNVRNYISENRSRLVKPIIFIIVTSLIYSVCNSFFHLEDRYMTYQGDHKSAISAIFAWVQGHYGYANIIMSVFIALWIKLFFRKSPYNLFEILILLCFVMGMGMLIFAAFGVAEGLTHFSFLKNGMVLGLVYIIFAIGQFFGPRKVTSYVKALFAYLLGMLTFSVAALAIGAIIDLLLHK
ncbi:DUF3667 domain-containing protein [Rufibacter immobilis]|uniref:DUF3667 domain-containing protein n=1 Tax=Rufibacter immobilis TaxID=1348778 RepID=A0A3M9MXP1_9BACT|nr:DUF3667 domain-containing protein [Rufibacter immobilis]RNI30296.1 DUF3667 domain-containing protein [Rufibacter immobilis]